MRKDLVNVPENVVILKHPIRNGKPEEIPLSDIPDSKASHIRRAIELLRANPTAVVTSWYYDGEAVGARHVSYRVAIKGMPGSEV